VFGWRKMERREEIILNFCCLIQFFRGEQNPSSSNFCSLPMLGAFEGERKRL